MGICFNMALLEHLNSKDIRRLRERAGSIPYCGVLPFPHCMKPNQKGIGAQSLREALTLNTRGHREKRQRAGKTAERASRERDPKLHGGIDL